MTKPSPTTTSRSSGRDPDLTPWLPIVEGTARRLAASPRARRVGAEYDDLVQEGLLSVVLSLRRGIDPKLAIANRMKDWIKYRARQTANEPTEYGAMLPTEAPDGEG